MGWKADYTGRSFDAKDRPRIVPGWYWAKLTRCQEDAKSGALVCEWTVSRGTYAGCLVRGHNLHNPDHEYNEDARKQLARRFALWCRRVGLTGDAHEGRDVDVDPRAALNVERVIQLEAREFEGREGGTVKTCSIPYMGIYPPDHADIPPEWRIALGLPLLAGQVLPKQAPENRKGPRRKGDDDNTAASGGRNRPESPESPQGTYNPGFLPFDPSGV